MILAGLVLAGYVANVIHLARAVRSFAAPRGTPAMMYPVLIGGALTTLATGIGLVMTPAGPGRLAAAAAGIAASGALFRWAMIPARAHGFGMAFAGVAPRALVTTGPYRYLRHPIYVAYAINWWSGCLGTTSMAPVFLAIGMSVLYALAALKEERELAGLRSALRARPSGARA